MERITQQALDKEYKDYFFLGRERNEDANFICVETSNDDIGIRTAFKDLMIADKEYKWWLLDAVLKAFEFCNDNEYEEFLKHIKLCKRGRYTNVMRGKIVSTKNI